jgi:tetratricopeptide (TPR) repeat protein
MMNTDTMAPIHHRRPRPPRLLAFVAATAIILAGSYALSALRAGAPAAVTPVRSPAAAPGEQGAALIGSEGGPSVSFAGIDHSIDAWTKNLAANPKDYLSATNIAILYHGRGRLSYDLGDQERALTAARTALAIEPTYAPARAVEATIQFTLHDFRGAFATADALVKEDPSQLGALATRFDAAIELGRIDDARADLKALAGAGGPALEIRQARLESVTGDTGAALASARRARSAAAEDDAEDLGFFDYAVGEYARLDGDALAALAAYRQALDVRDTDVAALVGLARIDAFDGRVDDAIRGLRRAITIAPQPEALALLGDLEASVGDPAAGKAFDTVRFIEKLGDIQSTTYDRQLLRFELDHGGASDAVLGRARASVADRPDWTGYDVLAWALYRTGRLDEAGAAIASARELGADDARLRYHDGAIKLAAGDHAAGTALLRSALDLGPALDPIERREAERLLAG